MRGAQPRGAKSRGGPRQSEKCAQWIVLRLRLRRGERQRPAIELLRLVLDNHNPTQVAVRRLTAELGARHPPWRRHPNVTPNT